MTDRGLFFRRELGKSFPQRREVEKRIVAEASTAPRFTEHLSPRRAVECRQRCIAGGIGQERPRPRARSVPARQRGWAARYQVGRLGRTGAAAGAGAAIQLTGNALALGPAARDGKESANVARPATADIWPVRNACREVAR